MSAQERIEQMRGRAFDPKASLADFMKAVSDRFYVFTGQEIDTSNPEAFIKDLDKKIQEIDR